MKGILASILIIMFICPRTAFRDINFDDGLIQGVPKVLLCFEVIEVKERPYEMIRGQKLIKPMIIVFYIQRPFF